MSKIKYFVQQSWLLIVASFFFGLLIAVTNAALSSRIEQNKINKRNRLVGALLPEAKNFVLETEIEVESAKGKKVKSNVYKAISDANTCVGWAFNCEGPGFQDKIELVVAVDKDFERIAGFSVLASNETPGFGDKIKLEYFRNQFAGAPAEELQLVKTGDAKKIDSEIVGISGATVSSEAVVKIINHYIKEVREAMQRKGLLGNDKE